jgi:hypothetical protein
MTLVILDNRRMDTAAVPMFSGNELEFQSWLRNFKLNINCLPSDLSVRPWDYALQPWRSARTTAGAVTEAAVEEQDAQGGLSSVGTYQDWLALNQAIVLRLLNRLELNIRELFFDFEGSTLQELLDALHEHFGVSVVAAVSQAVDEFFELGNTEKPDSSSMLDHIAKFEIALRNLRLVGCTMNERVVAVVFLKSLPDSFDSTRKAVEQDERFFTKQHVFAQAKSEARQQQLKAAKQKKQEEAYLAMQTDNRASTTKPKTCFVCGKEGHFKASCPNKKDEKKTSGQSTAKDGKIGHGAAMAEQREVNWAEEQSDDDQPLDW